ncbi:MAG: hypothetical protein BMS9Abin08_0523 [Gammaproteobacteria bacterium]|nr:MAG: hypothetical protein BMS9Abin08_0523 [Gammaproteobacteria bacterium]
MKCAIPLVLVVALTGCDQTADNRGLDKHATTGSTNVADTDHANKTLDRQAESPRAHVFQFGIYKATRKGQIKISAQTNTGKVIRKPTLEHVSMTDRIPLTKDTYFGYQYRLFELPPEAMIKPVMPLRKVLIHPEMTLPDGSRTTGWDRTFKGRVETQQVMGFDGYAFNEDYELVEGDWIFQIWYQDKKLIERKFVSVQPEQE